MRNGLVRMTRIRGKTVVVSAICLGCKVRVEAACALDGEENGPQRRQKPADVSAIR